MKITLSRYREQISSGNGIVIDSETNENTVTYFNLAKIALQEADESINCLALGSMVSPGNLHNREP